MIQQLYKSPTRVYCFLAFLAAIGIYLGTKLPVSLFPQSSKPHIYVSVRYGSMTMNEFQKEYGNTVETQLRTITGFGLKIDEVQATYEVSSVSYHVRFDWGSTPEIAKKEVERIVYTWAARLTEDVRDTVSIWLDNENSGFYAASFYSDKRSLDDLYDLLDDALRAKITAVPDADMPGLWNPSRKEIRIELKPDAMANLRLMPRDIEKAVHLGLVTRDGGSLTVGLNSIRVQMNRYIADLDALAAIAVPTPSGKIVHLRDIANVDFGPQLQSSRIFKTSGTPSIILYATPKPGGNVKAMAEDLKSVIENAKKTLPPDVQYKVLVDPSLFIRNAIHNVFHEVLIGSLLAVSVLFLFIGSFKNVATAAIEIPLSLVLAFILMYFFGVNLNLISLGGLALSAGMNVDASVVVMENIFRHFEKFHGKALVYEEKFRIVIQAVKEVRVPIIASTVASLVVFIPLLLTSDLSYAILGDLAKAVIFSHAFSAVVALILVPTVRLHLMSSEKFVRPQHSRFEKQLIKIESWYVAALRSFITSARLKWIVYVSTVGVLGILIWLALPRLPQEVIGKPDSDMIFLSFTTQGNTLTRQMESVAEDVEFDLMKKFGSEIQYTFVQIASPNRSWLLARLADKSHMTKVWKEMEKHFTNTPQLRYEIEPWNPSELPIPDPPDLMVAIRGGEILERRNVAVEIQDLLETKKILPRVWTEPNIEHKNSFVLTPFWDQWVLLNQQSQNFSFLDLMDVSRVATEGRKIGQIPIRDKNTDINMRYPNQFLQNIEDLAGLPIGIGGKIVPLKALMKIDNKELSPPIYKENGQDVYFVRARRQMSDRRGDPIVQARARAEMTKWIAEKKAEQKTDKILHPIVQIEDPGKDVTRSTTQLGFAIIASVFLIFVVLVLQFGSLVESLIILVAVPLGVLGVILSLWIFGSSLSLNSAFGVILLNGIAVNNSIILVDFIKRLWESGLPPLEAALEAARKRLRPILITSLTTVLGMLPIALGFGDGGRILQPLGVAVSGGLWISMLLTLLIVPTLYVSYLQSVKQTHA